MNWKRAKIQGKVTVTQVITRYITFFKLPPSIADNTYITILVHTGELKSFCDLVNSNLMQSPHLASHCVPSYKPTELPVRYCVKLYFFLPLFSWPFFQHPSAVLRSELQREPPTVPSWWPLLVNPLVQETALHSPPKYFSCKQWCTFVSVSHHRRHASLG